MSAKPEENDLNSKESKDESRKLKLGRSISLSKLSNEDQNPDKDQSQQLTSKRKAPDHPSPSTKNSPKDKLSVKETKAKFELQEKYRNQRNLKDMKKESQKFKGRACRNTTEVIEDPIAKMIRDMHADIKEVKSDQKKTTNTIDDLSQKLSKIEKKSNENDLINKKSIEDINDKMNNIKDWVTTKLLAEIEPSLIGMKNQIENSINKNLRRIVQEELGFQKMAEAKKVVDEEMHESDPEKNKKIQKNIKNQNKKKWRWRRTIGWRSC